MPRSNRAAWPHSIKRMPSPASLPSAAALHRVTLHGPADAARTVLLVHGFGTDQTIWHDLLPLLDPALRVITYDQAGCGQCDPSVFVQHHYLNLHGFAKDLATLAQSLDLRDAILVGHSFGAMVGVLAALQVPACFSRLALIGASPRYLDDGDYHGGFQEQDIDQVYRMAMANYSGWADAYAPVAVGQANGPDLAARFARSLKAIPPERALTILCAILQSDHRQALPLLNHPVRILQTQRDSLVPLPVAQYMARALPHAELRMLDAEGHLPHLTAPDQVAAALREFLR